MNVFSKISEYDHEQVVFCQSSKIGLKAIIAIHNTILGPALGGTRMWPYLSEKDALTDVLRLSRAMTYKAALADLPLGGGKAVIIGDPNKDKNKDLFRAYSHFINTLAGRFITAEDVGTNVSDMECILNESSFVVGTDKSHGGSGNPSPFTAMGVFYGIRACLNYMFHNADFKGKTFVILGVGSVGSSLAKFIQEAGGNIIACDIDQNKVTKLALEIPLEIVQPKDIFKVKCDVFCPCAMGGIINDDTIKLLNCKIIAGAANNQLQEIDHAKKLKKKNICYAPDYVINAGGLINVYFELEKYNEKKSKEKIRSIYDTVTHVLKVADEMNITTAQAADFLAEHKIEEHRHSNKIFYNKFNPHRPRQGEKKDF
ncbi:MAG: leucine dehydrogenase [Deltaproteobacteria bacterium CG07_land_8_20_14_0_80_38_7]|nr:MAG: leucine dehydrogenase [Deltaproteobacteria bacterium CG07_land_8_20_14_0_80_38_7]